MNIDLLIILAWVFSNSMQTSSKVGYWAPETAIAVGISKSSGSSMDVSCGFVVTTMFKSFHLLLIYVSILVIISGLL